MERRLIMFEVKDARKLLDELVGCRLLADDR